MVLRRGGDRVGRETNAGGCALERAVERVTRREEGAVEEGLDAFIRNDALMARSMLLLLFT